MRHDEEFRVQNVDRVARECIARAAQDVEFGTLLVELEQRHAGRGMLANERVEIDGPYHEVSLDCIAALEIASRTIGTWQQRRRPGVGVHPQLGVADR